jgi:hypothetical protein
MIGWMILLTKSTKVSRICAPVYVSTR